MHDVEILQRLNTEYIEGYWIDRSYIDPNRTLSKIYFWNNNEVFCLLSGLSISAHEKFIQSCLFGILSIGGSIGLQIQSNHVNMRNWFINSVIITHTYKKFEFCISKQFFCFNKQFSLCLCVFNMLMRSRCSVKSSISRSHSSVYIFVFCFNSKCIQIPN